MARLLLFAAGLGLVLYFVVTSFGPFKDTNLTNLYPKPSSNAASTLQTGIQPGQPINDSGAVLINASVADKMASTGAKWVRINFRLGPYSSDNAQFYAAYDSIVNNLKSKNLQVVGLVSNESYPGGQASWVANNRENTGGDGNNSYITQFCQQFARIAKHYENQITYWEVWNEPNAYNSQPSPGVFQGGSFIYPSNFAALLTECHAQVHHYNKINVQIISGGVFGHNIGGGYNSGSAGADYIDSTYNMGINVTGKFTWAKNTYGSYPLDAIGQHIYMDEGTTLNTTQYNNYLDYVHNVLTKWEGTASPKKTWITEFGWGTNHVNDSLQASNLLSALNVYSGKSYVATAIWFQLDDVPVSNLFYGLYRTDGTKKPAWDTFNNFSNSNNPQPTPASSIVGKTSTGATIQLILNFYNNFGGQAANGLPFDNGGTAYAHVWDYGYVQDFQGGSIGRNIIFDTGFRVQAGFYTTYLTGNNHNILKFPINNEYAFGSGARQDFQGGYLTWDPANGVRLFTGSAPTPTPTKTPTPTPTKTPTPTPISSVVGKTSTGTTIQPILNFYNNFGGATANGTPYDNGGTIYAHWWDYGYVQDFRGGSIGPNIIFDTGHRVQASFFNTYLSGNNHSILRFPTSDEYGYGAGTRQDFQGGYMTWDTTNGVRVFPR